MAIFLLWIKLKLSPNCCEESQLAFLLVWSVTLLTMFFYKIKKYCAYLKRQDEYLEKKNSQCTSQHCCISQHCCFQRIKKSWGLYVFPIIIGILSVFRLCKVQWDIFHYDSIVIYVLLLFSAIYTGIIISKTRE
jgi:hypothetical protein